VFLHGAPLAAVLPHYRLVLLALLSLILSRIILSRLIWNQFGLQLAAAIIAAFFLFVVLFYYGLVLVGLGSWGQVASLDLIASYATQLPDLAETLEIPLLLAISTLAFVYALLFAAAWRYIKKFDWIFDLTPSLTGRRIPALSAFGAVIWATELFNFFMSPATDRGEPVALTFFPVQATRSIPGDVIDKSAIEKLDQIEDAERSAYKISASADRKNLVLIVVDALRPDHLGIYGYERDTTPNLGSLQKSGAMRQLTGVRSSCSASACGLLSLASSKFVHQFSNRPFVTTGT
jgi:glucan phosphoethanolaminetransferase (alkaline phosphatase superfamily)